MQNKESEYQPLNNLISMHANKIIIAMVLCISAKKMLKILRIAVEIYEKITNVKKSRHFPSCVISKLWTPHRHPFISWCNSNCDQSLTFLKKNIYIYTNIYKNIFKKYI